MTQYIINAYCCNDRVRVKKCHCKKYKYKQRKRVCKNGKKKGCRTSNRKAGRNKSCKVRTIIIKCPRYPKVSIRPVVRRYFYIASENIDVTEGVVIQAHQFVDDKGEPIDKFMSFGKQGYFNLYVNGVLQEGKLYHIKTKNLKLAEMEQMILNRTPIIVESVGFTTKLVYK